MKKVLTALALSMLAAPAALACSCMPCETQPSLLESDYTQGAFVGELLSVRKITSPDFPADADTGFAYPSELVHLFKVTRSLKGDLPKYVMVRTASNSAACGATFSFESLNAVAVSADAEGHYRSNSCSQMCWGADQNRSLITEDTPQTWRDPSSVN